MRLFAFRTRVCLFASFAPFLTPFRMPSAELSDAMQAGLARLRAASTAHFAAVNAASAASAAAAAAAAAATATAAQPPPLPTAA